MYDVIECVDGCLVAVGTTQSFNGSGQDAWMVKIDKNGKTVFRKTFGTNNMEDMATAVAELPSGLLVTGGISTPKEGSNDNKIKSWLRCRDPKGNKIWDRETGEHSYSLSIEDIVVDREHNQIIVLGIRSERLWLVITDYSGEKRLDREIKANLLDKLPVKMAKMSLVDGSVYVFGTAEYGKESGHPFVLKLSPFGQLVQQPVIFNDYNIAQSGQVTRLDSEWLLLPCSARQGKIKSDIAILKIDTALTKNTASFEVLEAYGDDNAIEIQPYAPGRFYVFGNTTSHKTGATKHDFCLLKANSEGHFYKDTSKEDDPFFTGTPFEDAPVRFIRTAEGKLWLCGTITKGTDLGTNTDFWFGCLNQKAALTPTAQPTDVMQPLVVTIVEQSELILLPGSNSHYSVTILNPNPFPVGELSLRSSMATSGNSVVLTPEISLPEIPAGGTLTVDVPVQVSSSASALQSLIRVGIFDTKKVEKGSAAIPVRVKALKIELADYQVVQGNAVKGSPFTIKAVFENVGSADATNVNLFWSAPPKVGFNGDYQQRFSDFKSGQRLETFISVSTSDNFEGNSLNLKAFWSEGEGEYKVTFPIKVDLDPPASLPVVSPVITSNNGLAIWVVWQNDASTENARFEQTYEIKVTAKSTKELKPEHFQVIVNGQVFTNDGQKFEEVPLAPPKKNGQTYTFDFIKKIILQPGKNIVTVKVKNDAGEGETDSPLVINYKPNDKGTLYVVSIGIPDKSGLIQFSQRDALDFGKLMATQKGRFYGTVELVTMVSPDSTEAKDIVSKLSSLVSENERKTFGEKDAVVVFISGHGYLDEDDGAFHIQGSDYDVNAKDQTTVNFDKVVAQLDRLSCLKFALVDACQGVSGDLAMLGKKSRSDDFDYSAALEKILKDSKKIRSMTSCSKGEFSYEDKKWQNGAFTHVLKNTLSDRAVCIGLDINKDNALSFTEIFPYIQTEVVKTVKETKKGKSQTPSMPKLIDGDVPFFFY